MMYPFMTLSDGTEGFILLTVFFLNTSGTRFKGFLKQRLQSIRSTLRRLHIL